MSAVQIGKPEFVFLIAALMMVDALAIDIMLPALPEIGAALSVANENDRSLVITAFLVGFGLPQIVFGPLSDSVGRRPVILGGLGLYIVCSLGAVFAADLTTMLVLRFVQGLGAAAVRVGMQAALRDRYKGREMAEVMSLVQSVFLLVPMFMPAVGQLLLLAGSWSVIFLVMAALAMIFGAWTWIRLAEPLADADRRPLNFIGIAQGFASVFSNRRAFFYGSASMFLLGAVFGMILTGPQVYGELYGWGPFYPVAMFIMGGSAALASLMVTFIIRRFGLRRSAHLAAVGLPALTLTGALISATFGMPVWGYVLIAILAAVPMIVGFATCGALSMEPLGAVAGTAAAVFGLIQAVCGAWLSYLIAQAYDGTVTPVLLGQGIMGLFVLTFFAIAENGRLFGRDPPNATPAPA
jgi:MFS transporter, DHA1 family, multidrug resistance protein